MQPIVRILVQAAVSLSRVAGRAFVQAYQDAVRQSQGSGGAAKAAETLKKQLNNQMSAEEARLVLNIKPSDSMETMEEAYKRLFELNDSKKGGSFYLQSKVYRAHETLSLEHQAQQATKNIPKPKE